MFLVFEVALFLLLLTNGYSLFETGLIMILGYTLGALVGRVFIR